MNKNNSKFIYSTNKKIESVEDNEDLFLERPLKYILEKKWKEHRNN